MANQAETLREKASRLVNEYEALGPSRSFRDKLILSC